MQTAQLAITRTNNMRASLCERIPDIPNSNAEAASEGWQFTDGSPDWGGHSNRVKSSVLRLERKRRPLSVFRVQSLRKRTQRCCSCKRYGHFRLPRTTLWRFRRSETLSFASTGITRQLNSEDNKHPRKPRCCRLSMQLRARHSQVCSSACI